MELDKLFMYWYIGQCPEYEKAREEEEEGKGVSVIVSGSTMGVDLVRICGCSASVPPSQTPRVDMFCCVEAVGLM